MDLDKVHQFPSKKYRPYKPPPSEDSNGMKEDTELFERPKGDAYSLEDFQKSSSQMNMDRESEVDVTTSLDLIESPRKKQRSKRMSSVKLGSMVETPESFSFLK